MKTLHTLTLAMSCLCISAFAAPPSAPPDNPKQAAHEITQPQLLDTIPPNYQFVLGRIPPGVFIGNPLDQNFIEMKHGWELKQKLNPYAGPIPELTDYDRVCIHLWFDFERKQITDYELSLTGEKRTTLIVPKDPTGTFARLASGGWCRVASN